VNNDFFNASNNSDIAEHLSNLYNVCLAKMPDSVLELGTRGGESTRVLVEYCERFDKKGFSIDLDSQPDWLAGKKWNHFSGDDIGIGQKIVGNQKWPDGTEFAPLDLIFLDSSHEYKHTLEELALYWPLIAPHGVLVLHDTNLTEKITRKLSGEVNIGWDNSAGVSRALQEFFGFEIDWNELTSFSGKDKNFDFRGIVHFPWNNGFTCIYK
jgi:predicted O-methyltransferase YrrM